MVIEKSDTRGGTVSRPVSVASGAGDGGAGEGPGPSAVPVVGPSVAVAAGVVPSQVAAAHPTPTRPRIQRTPMTATGPARKGCRRDQDSRAGGSPGGPPTCGPRAPGGGAQEAVGCPQEAVGSVQEAGGRAQEAVGCPKEAVGSDHVAGGCADGAWGAAHGVSGCAPEDGVGGPAAGGVGIGAPDGCSTGGFGSGVGSVTVVLTDSRCVGERVGHTDAPGGRIRTAAAVSRRACPGRRRRL